MLPLEQAQVVEEPGDGQPVAAARPVLCGAGRTRSARCRSVFGERLEALEGSVGARCSWSWTIHH